MIRALFLLFCFTLLSFANEYPKLFSQLGTPLYKVDEVFRDLSNFEKINDKSTQYHIHAEKLLALGREIENDPKAPKDKKQAYVKGLRELQKEYDAIMRLINGYLLQSIDANDYKEFSRIMNSKISTILDNSIIRKRAMAYYVAYRTRGKILALETSYQALDSDAALFEYVKGHMPKLYTTTSSYVSGGITYKIMLSKDEKSAYLAKGKHCFKSIDISNFSNASEIASFDYDGEGCDLRDITSSNINDKLYLSDAKNGFAILDLSLPDSPLYEGEYTRLRAINSFISQDARKAFIIRIKKGLSILDITQEYDFKILAQYNRGLEIKHLALDENRSRLYLAHSRGLSTLDISTIGNPREIASFPLQKGANYVVLSPDKKIAYIASGEDGVHVLDVSGDKNATLISTCLTPKAAYSLLLSQDGKKLYVSAHEDGVYTIDTQDPRDMRHIATYKLDKKEASALSSTLSSSEDALYISFGKAGMAKFKLPDK